MVDPSNQGREGQILVLWYLVDPTYAMREGHPLVPCVCGNGSLSLSSEAGPPLSCGNGNGGPSLSYEIWTTIIACAWVSQPIVGAQSYACIIVVWNIAMGSVYPLSEHVDIFPVLHIHR